MIMVTPIHSSAMHTHFAYAENTSVQHNEEQSIQSYSLTVIQFKVLVKLPCILDTHGIQFHSLSCSGYESLIERICNFASIAAILLEVTSALHSHRKLVRYISDWNVQSQVGRSCTCYRHKSFKLYCPDHKLQTYAFDEGLSVVVSSLTTDRVTAMVTLLYVQ